MKILAIGTSNNANSINRTLAAHAAGLVEGATVEVLDIHDYEMPIFSDAREEELGSPPQAAAFAGKIAEADAIVVSFAEHNGSYTAAWKNLFDWTSRLGKEVFQQKPSVFLATSPGPGGAASVLASAVDSADYFGAALVGSLSVPSFHDNFDRTSQQLTNAVLATALRNVMRQLVESLLAVSTMERTAGLG